jgi:cytochrome P450 family 3 subfamily A
MVDYNRRNPDNVISDEDVVGNILLFVFAAYDTSRNSTGFGLHFLGRDLDSQSTLLKEAYTIGTLVKGGGSLSEPTMESLDKSVELKAQVVETLRLGAPFTTTEIRKLTKNVKIGPLSLKKGDYLVASLVLNQFKESEFPKAYKFDRTRHYKGKIKYQRNNNSPFGHGPRACIGKYMGKMNIQVILLKFIENFEFEYLEGEKNFSHVNEAMPFHTLETVDLRLKLRTK